MLPTPSDVLPMQRLDLATCNPYSEWIGPGWVVVGLKSHRLGAATGGSPLVATERARPQAQAVDRSISMLSSGPHKPPLPLPSV